MGTAPDGGPGTDNDGLRRLMNYIEAARDFLGQIAVGDDVDLENRRTRALFDELENLATGPAGTAAQRAVLEDYNELLVEQLV